MGGTRSPESYNITSLRRLYSHSVKKQVHDSVRVEILPLWYLVFLERKLDKTKAMLQASWRAHFRRLRLLSSPKTIFPLALTLAGWVLFASSDPVSILVRDARTHYAVRATVRLQGPDSATLHTDATGRLTYMVAAGRYGVWYGVEVWAPGYKRAASKVLPGLSAPLTIMLVPERPPPEEQPGAPVLRLRPGYALLHGYTVDFKTGQPISGVRVRVNAAESLTDARGHYWLSVPMPGSPEPQTRKYAVVAEKEGYETIISNESSMTGEDMQGPLFDMQKGAPWAILGHTIESARASLEAGVDPNLKDNRGWTALSLACNSGNIGLARALIKAGADLNLEGAVGWTPLMEASYFNHVDIVELLIQAGALINQHGKDGLTAFMLARWMCHSDVVEALKRAGAVIGTGEWTRAPDFNDFPISRIYKGVPAPVDLKSNSKALVYRTRLREGVRKGPNFAGLYTAISWGCGSNCESTMIVDAFTGRVYDGFGDERGAEFGINSRLIVADSGAPLGPPANPDNPTEWLPIRYYEWKNHSLQLIYEEACAVIDRVQKCGCEALTLPLHPSAR